MANTLFIVKDAAFKAMPSPVADGAVAEVRRIFGFLRTFTVSVQEPAAFPERLDFTDSIVKIVEADDAVSAAIDQARRAELDNVVASARKNGVNLTRPPESRSVFNPDRGGVAFQQKEVIDPSGLRLIMALTGGVASQEFAKEAVVEFATGGRSLQDVQDSQNKGAWGPSGRPKPGQAPNARYFASHQSLRDIADEQTWGLMKKGLGDWPRNLQDDVAVALGRSIAHEARHQYIGPHAANGLGADAPIIFGDQNFQDFDASDRSDIFAKLTSLARQQAAGRTHLDTIARGRAFPFG